MSSLVWPDLFTLQARFQLSNTYQKRKSTRPMPSPLLRAQTCITLSVHFFLCMLNALCILPCTPVLIASNISHPFVTLVSFIFPFFFGLLSTFERSFEKLYAARALFVKDPCGNAGEWDRAKLRLQKY